jgi:hypothetical protein
MAKTTKICETCGEEFSRPKGYAHAKWFTKRFCSQKCRIKWKSKEQSETLYGKKKGDKDGD